MKTDKVTRIRFRKSQGVTGWYQSFDCSELGFLLESSLQSLGLSHGNIFFTTNKMFFIVFIKTPRSTNQTFSREKQARTLVGGIMSSFESISLSDEHDPMAIISDDEVAHVPEIFTSDSESDLEMMSDDDDLDDIQSFALSDFGDDVPFVDDVLALPLPPHDQLIIGHSDGEHLVELIPIHAIPLAAIPSEDWPFVVDLDDDVDVPVIEVDHPNDDFGDGEVLDIVILDVASLVVSVIDISSDSDADSFESMTFSALRAAGLEAYPTDDGVVSVAPATPVHVPTPTGTPPHTPVRATGGSSSQPPAPTDHSSWLLSIRYAPAFPHTPPTHGGEPLGHPHIPPPESSLCLHSPRVFPPYTMSLSDPYHPSHHSEILCRRVYELESEADARWPSPPDYPPLVTPPPPSSPPPVPPPPPVHASVDGHIARFITLEQQVSFLIHRVHELEDEVAYLRRMAFPTPPSPPAP
ncbi:hypothetical protein Hanom_Chr12g01157361 [Helianthus anomalus]